MLFYPVNKHLGSKFLFWCAHTQISFRTAELEALLALYNIKCEWIEPSVVVPYVVLKLSDEKDAKSIMSRTVVARSCYDIWASAESYDELFSQLKAIPKEELAPYCQADKSFRIQVESFGKKLSPTTKVEKIESLSFLPLEGPIQLNNPDYSFHLVEYYGTNPNTVPDQPYKIFFGRWVCDGQRHMINKINLKQRKFIAHTTMDPTLSLIMANMALVKKNDLILDPLVGSGSLLIAAAHFGGYVLGTDIDYLVLHGKAKPTRYQQKAREPDECIQTNLKQYGVESRYLDVLVADAALPVWREDLQFDAIITDPPYGIRESTERIGTNKSNNKIPEHLAAAHIPSKVTYSLQDILTDLLNFSTQRLRLRGRLVYWLPVVKEEFTKESIPSHPCLRLVSYCEQSLTHHSSRYLITMEKTMDPKGQAANVTDTTSMFRLKYFKLLKNS